MPNQYDFTPALKEKILAKIKQKNTPGKLQLTCPVCGGWNWEMADGFASIVLLKNVWTETRGSNLPSAALVCIDCGNTLLFNLIALGFALDIGPDMDEIRKLWGAK